MSEKCWTAGRAGHMYTQNGEKVSSRPAHAKTIDKHWEMVLDIRVQQMSSNEVK